MSKHGPRASDNPSWEQRPKERIEMGGTLRAPVKANGEDGIVIGGPPGGVLPKTIGGGHLHPLLRLKRRLARI